MSVSDWSKYEQDVFDSFKFHFPNAEIRRNVRIRGRFSKKLRQIDILIIEQTPAGPSQTVVDAKLYTRKLDVKAVDEFAGFVDDIGAKKGLLITNTGYTRSAFRRAHYSPRNLELDVLNFSELQRWQSFGGIPYVGDRGFLVPAPFGWVLDINRVEDTLCTMFQRGLDVATARKRKEFLYISAWIRKNNITALELDRLQLERLRACGLDIISVRRKVGTRKDASKRKDANVLIRYLHIKQYKCIEVTGFLEFKDIILFVVLLTPKEKEKQNVRRLQHVLRSAVPVTLQKDNSRLIASLKEKLDKASSKQEKVDILVDIGHWHRDSKQLPEARQYLEESVSLVPTYHGIRELVHVLIGLGECFRIRELLNTLLGLDPANPTVYNDALEFAHSAQLENELLAILDSIAAKESSDSLVRANSLYYAGQLLIGKGDEAAKGKLLAAQQIFRRALPRKHQVFAALRFSLRQCVSRGSRIKGKQR